MSEFTDPDAYHRAISHDNVRRGIPKGAASGLAVANENFYDSFEQFLLEKGEKKVEMKLDTRVFSVWSHTCDTSLTSFRNAQYLDLHVQQGRPYFGKPPTCSAASRSSGHICRLQGV